jgi:Fe-S-cluster-containing dehydrogenase component
MTQYAILTDLNRCVGCLACCVACKAVNNVPVGNYWNKILRIGPNKKEGAVRSSDVEMYYLPVQCQHCADPECVKVCPTQASHKREDGTVQIDKSKCIGCQFCVMACPYGVRYLNEEERVVEKCTLCEQIVAQGGLPQCVIQCGGRARFFGDLTKGIESFEAPAVGYDTDRSYNTLYAGNRVTVKELAKQYGQSDIHTLPDVGNSPSFSYILRDRIWQGGK